MVQSSSFIQGQPYTYNPLKGFSRNTDGLNSHEKYTETSKVRLRKHREIVIKKLLQEDERVDGVPAAGGENVRSKSRKKQELVKLKGT